MSAGRDSVEFRDVSCQRQEAALRGASMTVPAEGWHTVRGDAGALLWLRLATLRDVPDSGEVRVFGEPTVSLDENERAALRSRIFGFVFAAPYLLPGMCAAENVAMPLFKLVPIETMDAVRRTESILELVGFQSTNTAPAEDLSRLDQHRVALARALVHEPAVLVIDDLDKAVTGEEAMILQEAILRARRRRTFLVLAYWANGRPEAIPGGRVEVIDGVASFHQQEPER
jgi:predicted ABC-type transport system involved in lysophospholipase L1 biosynthesis ATPase subunit